MKAIRSAAEAEIISEFLKTEYHKKEYHADRAKYESLVFGGNLADEEQNEIRKALLFRRYRATWNEIPQGIRWLLVQLEPDDIQKLRVFPRGHWRKMADRSETRVLEVAQKIRDHHLSPNTTSHITAIHALAYRMRKSRDMSSIILVGLDMEQPMTVLEGNHRMLAAALISADRACGFRTYVGLSPNMNSCNWYSNGNGASLKHAWRRVKNMQPRLTAAMKSFAFSMVSD